MKTLVDDDIITTIRIDKSEGIDNVINHIKSFILAVKDTNLPYDKMMIEIAEAIKTKLQTGDNIAISL
ncbi:hypothetical protein [Candidatus Nitrosocosmicus sp. R]